MLKRVVWTGLCLTAAGVMTPWSSAQTIDEILGPWNATINAAGQQREVRLFVTRDDGELGVLVSTPQGDQPAENVSYENQVLSFTIKFGPANLDISVNVDGEAFTGQADSPFGPLEISGSKVSEGELAEIRQRLEPLVGDWETITEFQGERIESKLRIELEGGRLMGANMAGAQAIDAEGFVPIRVQDDELSWRIPIPYVTESGGFVTVSLNRDDMTFEGVVRSSLGEIPIYGEYVDTTKLVQTPYDDPTQIIGDWELEVTMAGETAPAMLTIKEEESRLKAMLHSAVGDYASNQVEYNKIGETMGTLRIHADIPTISEDTLVFEFIIDGDTFDGEEIFTDGEILVSGKKVSDQPGSHSQAAVETPGAPGGGVTADMVMSMLDSNGDGSITMEEAPEQLKQFFTVVDANADGSIDLAEAETIADFMNAQGGGPPN